MHGGRRGSGARRRARQWRARGRSRLQQLATAALERTTDGSVLVTEYPITPRSRYGWGEPAHPRLEERIAAGRAGYHDRMRALERHLPELRAIDRVATDVDPGWENVWFSGLDAVVLYGSIVDRRPARYVEVGSGHSTRFVRRAIRDHGLGTTITSIDPQPRAEVDRLCDEVVRTGLEDVGAAPFAELEHGDVVLIDGSHNCFTGGDVAVTFLEVLPEIPPGVLVGIDDIFLPWDYPPDWVGRWYAEQYLLATLLLADDPGWQVVLPDFWLVQDPASRAVVERFEDPARTTRFGLSGVTFWIERAG